MVSAGGFDGADEGTADSVDAGGGVEVGAAWGGDSGGQILGAWGGGAGGQITGARRGAAGGTALVEGDAPAPVDAAGLRTSTPTALGARPEVAVPVSATASGSSGGEAACCGESTRAGTADSEGPGSRGAAEAGVAGARTSGAGADARGTGARTPGRMSSSVAPSTSRANTAAASSHGPRRPAPESARCRAASSSIESENQLGMPCVERLNLSDRCVSLVEVSAGDCDACGLRPLLEATETRAVFEARPPIRRDQGTILLLAAAGLFGATRGRRWVRSLGLGRVVRDRGGACNLPPEDALAKGLSCEELRIDFERGVDGSERRGTVAAVERGARMAEVEVKQMPSSPGIHGAPKCKSDSDAPAV